MKSPRTNRAPNPCAEAFAEAPDGFCLLDQKGRFLQVNRVLCEMLEYSEAELRNLSYEAVLPPEDRSGGRDLLLQFWRNGTGAHRDFIRCLTKSGLAIPVRRTITAVRMGRGSPKRLALWMEDQREEHRVAERIQELEEQCVRAQRCESIAALANGIAHDLNNVFTPLMMGVDVLRSQAPPGAPLAELLQMFQSTIQRGTDIVRQVLTCAKALKGEKILLQPKHLIQQVIQVATGTFPKAIKIRSTIATQLWPVLGDALQLHQVLLDLSINARDAMPQGGTLLIQASNCQLEPLYARMISGAKPGTFVLIEIKDTGAGMPAAIADKIFGPFITGDDPEAEGRLRLSTARTIVEGHGGFIRLQTEAGKGSCFQIYLPASPPAEAAHAAPAEQLRGNGEMIIVLDDEPGIREISREVLTAHGYEAATADSGTEAAMLVSQNREKVRAVVTDLMMPLMDGVVVTRILKNLSPEIRIIACTGMDSVVNEDELRSLGVRTFLRKPYTAETLLRAIQADLRLNM